MLDLIFKSIAVAMTMTAINDLLINIFRLNICKSCTSFWFSLFISIILFTFGELNSIYQILFIASLSWILTIKTQSI